MSIPDSLQTKIDLFKASGKVFRYSDELFAEVAWHQVMLGQHLIPDDYHSIADSISDQQLTGMFSDLKALINKTVSQLPSHEQFLKKL